MQFVQKKIDKWARDAANVLLRYLRWMEFWNEFYKPESMEAEWHPLFAEVYWSSFLVTLCSEIMLYIETPLVSYSYSLNEVSHSCTS